MGFKIFVSIILSLVYYWILRNNHNWFLKMSVLGWWVFTVYMIFGSTEDGVITVNPIYAIPLLISSIGFLISVFVGIINACKKPVKSGVVMNIITIIFIVILFCTGIGAPFAITLLVKSFAKENAKKLN